MDFIHYISNFFVVGYHSIRTRGYPYPLYYLN